MQISDSLLCLFNARVEERDGVAVVEIPEHELEVGDVEAGAAYRVAILEPVREGGDDSGPDRGGGTEEAIPDPPVEEGEVREVEIEDMGEQGDGIARVERGYIVFVPETEVGEAVTIEITDVRENFAFGERIEDDDDGFDVL